MQCDESEAGQREMFDNINIYMNQAKREDISSTLLYIKSQILRSRKYGV